MPSRWPSMHGSARALTAVVLAACLLVACGDDEADRLVSKPDPQAAGAASPSGAAVPSTSGSTGGAGTGDGTGTGGSEVSPLPDVPIGARIDYALDRIERGPGRQYFRIPKVTDLSLRLATRDLMAMGREALARFREPQRLARITSAENKDTNPWHSMLVVLATLPGKDAETVNAWCEPALERFDVPLKRKCVRALVATPDEGIAPVLLRFFDQLAHDREAAPMAFERLIRGPSPYAEQAMDIATRRGADLFWIRFQRGLLPDSGGAEGTPLQATRLTWWALLAERSGPRFGAGLPRVRKFPWTLARPLLDPSVPRTRSQVDGETVAEVAIGPWADTTAYGTGWISADLGASGFIPINAYLLSGAEPAADARCLLARWGYPAFVASRAHDRTLDGIDPLRHHKTIHCVDPDEELAQRIKNLAKLETALDGIVNDGRIGLDHLLGALIDGSPSPSEHEASRQTLIRILESLRPHETYSGSIQRAFERLAEIPEVRRQVVMRMLREGDADDQGVARSLVRRNPEAEFIPVIRDQMARSEGREFGSRLRLLAYMYSRLDREDPRARDDFARRFVAWCREQPVQEMARLATGWLDLGPVGEAAFIEDLSTSRRPLLLRSLIGRTQPLPVHVAAAITRGVDRGTSRDERHAVLIIAYACFPVEAAPHLEAMRKRLPSSVDKEVAPVVERVRHRAPTDLLEANYLTGVGR